MTWLKLFSGIRNDPKLKRMSVHHRYAFIVLLCLASESEEKGTVLGFDDEDLAFELEMALEDWLILKNKLISKKLVEKNASGDLLILGWERHQSPIREIRFYGYRKHQEFVFIRDGFKCVYCKSTNKLSLDHVIPQSRGGSHEPENLVCCCSTCNSSKGIKTLEEWMGDKYDKFQN